MLTYSVMISVLVGNYMYRYGRHFGSFYHNPAIYRRFRLLVKWVNTDLILEKCFIKIKRQGMILAPMCLCLVKMWKSNVKKKCFHIISNVACRGEFKPRGTRSFQIVHSLSTCQHSRQSERQNITDITLNEQQRSVTILEDSLTTNNDFYLR